MRSNAANRQPVWSDRLFNVFGSLGPAALMTDVHRLSDRDLGDIGAPRTDTGDRADRAMAKLRSKGYGPVF